MNRRPLRIALAVASLGLMASAVLFAQGQAPPPAKRVALLVGINAYQRRGFVDLKWAENDVDEMGQELKRLGFDKVVTMKGSSTGELRATRVNIDVQLKKLLAEIGKNDVVLVMLTGHGQQLPVKRDGVMVEDGFYCPADAVLNEPETMVSLSRLTDETLRKWGGKNLVLVDACRDGVVDNDKGVARGIQGKVVALPEGTAVLFACAAGQRSLEKDSLKHGVFTHGVLEALRTFDGSNALTWSSLVDRVQGTVAELNPDQEPISAGVLGRLVLANRVAGRPANKADIPANKKVVMPSPKAAEPDRSPIPTVTDQSLEGSKAGELREDNSLKMKFRWCPAGKFRMGSPPGEVDRGNDEGPIEVTLSRGYWMGQFEVTQSQWQAVMGTTIREQSEKTRYNSNYGQGADYPIHFVDHDEAKQFCSKLTNTERDAGRLPPGWIYMLPTEAQWEYACRAGTNTATAFGNSLGYREANCDGARPYNDAEKGPASHSTQRVGQYRPNAWNLYDMHGNVWEWCRDWYDNQLSGGIDPNGAPVESPKATKHVIRGGGWNSEAYRDRSAGRGWFAPEMRTLELGFRVALVRTPAF
jgi:formylglycine-generating enzyme